MEVELVIDLEFTFLSSEKSKNPYQEFKDVRVSMGIDPREWMSMTQEERDEHIDATIWEQCRVHHKIKHQTIRYTHRNEL